MKLRAALLAASLMLAAPGPARGDDLAIDPAEVDALRARLAGHQVRISDDSRVLTIDDVAGEGPPHIGVIARDGDHLVLVTATARWRLTGPLARPRIAGPGYTVWLVGEPAHGSIPTLRAKRVGILRRPAP
jgi:hypothetical protein